MAYSDSLIIFGYSSCIRDAPNHPIHSFKHAPKTCSPSLTNSSEQWGLNTYYILVEAQPFHSRVTLSHGQSPWRSRISISIRIRYRIWIKVIYACMHINPLWRNFGYMHQQASGKLFYLFLWLLCSLFS